MHKVCTVYFQKLFEKSPISCALVKNTSCLKPEELISESDHHRLKMKRLFRYLIHCKILNESHIDLDLPQYYSFHHNDCEIIADKIASFIKNKDLMM